MKTLHMRAFGKPALAAELVESDRAAAGAGQVLVALEAAPINPSDLLLMIVGLRLEPWHAGAPGPLTPYPTEP